MRRWFAFWLVLVLLVPLPAASVRGQEQATYTSPTYGFTVRWDPSVWTEVPDETLVAEGPDALDRLRLESPISSLYVEASRRYAGDAARCSGEELGLFTLSPDVADVQIRSDLAATEPERSVEAAAGTLMLDSGESLRLGVYVECRRLSAEATLYVTLIGPADVFAQSMPLAQTLIETIELPDGGTANGDVFRALQAATAATPEVGPTDGSLTLATGTLDTLSAGVDLADVAVAATFTNPYAGSDHPFDFGLGFRQGSEDEGLKLVIDSDGVWYLKDGLGPLLASGRVAGLLTEAGAQNTVELIAAGPSGGFAVNGAFMAELDLTARTTAGDVVAGSGFFAEDVRAGATTGVAEFAVWSLAPADEPRVLDESNVGDWLAAAQQAAPLAGPDAGTLTQIDGAASLAEAGLAVTDFAARVRWANPDTAFWDVGVAFRDQPDGRHYRLTFDQNGGWAFGIGLEPKLATGGAATMSLGPGGINTLELVGAGEQAAFSINGAFVALLDVSAIDEPGDVWFGTGFNAANVTPGTDIRYRDLTVWPLPAVLPATPATPAEAATPETTPAAKVPVEATTAPLPEPPVLPTLAPTATATATAPLPTAPSEASTPAAVSPTGPPEEPPATPPRATSATTAATPVAAVPRVVALRLDEIAGSGIAGLATVTEVAGNAAINVGLEGAAGGEVPAVVPGTCQDLDLAAAPLMRLTPIDEVGRSRTILEVPVGDILDTGLALAVFASDDLAADLIACGAIVR